MTVDQCSIDAYYKTEPKREVQKDCIFNAVKDHEGLCSREISRITGIPRTSVCGRLRELEDDGLIQKAGRKVDHVTNVTVNCYRAVVQ